MSEGYQKGQVPSSPPPGKKIRSWFLSKFTGLKLRFASYTVWPEKIAKCLSKLPKNDFTRNMKDFDTFTKIA